MLHLITTERQVQLRGGGPASICAYAKRPPRQRLSTNGVSGKVGRRRFCLVASLRKPQLPRK